MGLQDFTFNRFVTNYIAIGVFWTILQTFILSHYGLDLTHALFDALLTSGLILLAGISTYNILRHYKPARENALYPRVWAMLLTIMVTMSFNAIMRALHPNDSEYLAFIELSAPVRAAFNLLNLALLTAFIFMWLYFQDEQSKQQQVIDTENLAKEAELVSLRQQLQPHFLFNSLNSISALVGSRPEEARKMIHQLSAFLRGTLKKEDHQPYPLSQELHHLQLYLDIEKVRFGHRLSTQISTDEEANTCLIPPLILQPLVENAIKFGLYDVSGEVSIDVTCKQTEDYLQVTITNPFDPKTSTPKKGAGFGLSSVQRRLYLLYARNDLLVTKHENNLFTTLVKIPRKL